MEIIVIGGGASGMLAAIAAARNGAKVTIVEKNNMLGKKILATGNGRCNFTNEFCTYIDYLEARDFVKPSLCKFGFDETIGFFRGIGVMEKPEGEGRIYPFSNQAASVLDAITFEIDSLKINILLETSITKLIKDGSEFVLHTSKAEKLVADKVIIATGGYAGGVYGCTGEGYKLAQVFGHKLNKPRPALTKLVCKENYYPQIKGVRARGKVTLKIEGQTKSYSDIGEIQFTEDGISGICVFNISRYVTSKVSYINKDKRSFNKMKVSDAETLVESRENPEKVCVAIDFFPELCEEDLVKILEKRKMDLADRPAGMLLNGMINSKLIPVLLTEIGFEQKKRLCEGIPDGLLMRISQKLKNWETIILGTSSFSDAQTTVGGILRSEVTPETMESKLISGLYFAGEILDVDAKCGGYNLQWAWTSGYVAGNSASS